MDRKHFEVLIGRFDNYSHRFIHGSSIPGPLQLKRDHALRVVDEIFSLASELALDDDSIHIAGAMALFHDLGRFRQFEKYRTFLDIKSENHARRSILEIDAHDMLLGCSAREKNLIRGAIAVHNAARVPRLKDSRKVFFMKLLRDADKLDIWRVVIDNYSSPDMQNYEFINLGLQDLRGCSPKAIEAIEKNRLVMGDSIGELNDFKLMQISWVFDLNFPQTMVKVRERGYVERLIESLSISRHDMGLDEIFKSVFRFMDSEAGKSWLN
ncbi:MAG: HD domain-containing protein [Desulfamplus sp.]|nr:HD domain-containing protein [Desulfamplus sp.]